MHISLSLSLLSSSPPPPLSLLSTPHHTHLQILLHMYSNTRHHIWHTVPTSVSFSADSALVASAFPLTTGSASLLLLAFDEVRDFSGSALSSLSFSFCLSSSFSLFNFSFSSLCCCCAFTFQAGASCNY